MGIVDKLKSDVEISVEKGRNRIQLYNFLINILQSKYELREIGETVEVHKGFGVWHSMMTGNSNVWYMIVGELNEQGRYKRITVYPEFGLPHFNGVDSLLDRSRKIKGIKDYYLIGLDITQKIENKEPDIEIILELSAPTRLEDQSALSKFSHHPQTLNERIR